MEGYSKIYLGNLSWDVTEHDLKKLFANCKIAYVLAWTRKWEFRGYAHIDFSDSVSLKIALKLDQEMIHGRPVKIRCAVPKKETERGGGAAAATAAETLPKLVPQMKENDTGLSSAVSSKMRRRASYECGEKGHLSSHCPKKQVVDSTAAETLPEPVPEMKEADTGLRAVSRKIRRRTCYKCGEKAAFLPTA